MRSIRLPGLLFAMMPLMLTGAKSPAQTAPQDAGNGLFDLMAAAESLQKSKQFPKTLEADATLTLKRRALQDPPVRHALSLLRQGLAKPVNLPRSDSTQVNFPQLAKFRSLARLLTVEQYVLLADGKVSAAVNSLRDGLRMGYLLMDDTLVSGLVGVAVESIAIHQIARNMQQLSARDCEQVIALVLERLNAPDPLLRVMQGERDFQRRMLREMFQEMQKEAGKASSLTPEEEAEQDPEVKEMIRQIRQNPAAMEAYQTEAMNLMTARFDLLFAELKKPLWERKETQQEMPDTPAGKLIGTLMELTGSTRTTESLTRGQVNVQLLGMHAAIRRFRWEHNRLPVNLEELKPGKLAIDPFTGQPLVYKRLDERNYELYSAGPMVYNEQGEPSGRRDHIHLPRKNP
jgi:hypothetical protein